MTLDLEGVLELIAEESPKLMKPERDGRDEMNLVEFQVALPKNRTLQLRRQGENIKTIKTCEWFTDKDGQRKEREWITTGSDEYGLPSEKAEDLIIAMIKTTKDFNNFNNRTVYFCEYDLLNLMECPTNSYYYKMLGDSLAQLRGVTIVARNAFWDNDKKEYLPFITFGIIEGAILTGNRRGRKNKNEKPGSYFVWNKVFWENAFKKNNIKFLDINFYFSLESYHSKRIYRYLSKYFYRVSTFEKDIFAFGQKAGLTGNYKYPSKVFEKLKHHLKELKEKKFLKDYYLYFHQGYKEHHIVCVAGEKGVQDRLGEKTVSPVQTFQQLLLPTQEEAKSLSSKAKEVVQYFQQKQNKIENYQPTQKELEQATEVLEKHGEEKTKYLIDYAIKKAQESKFQMQRFGAILTYIGEALPKYEQHQKAKEESRKCEQQMEEEEKRRREKEIQKQKELDNLYESLTEDQRQKLNQLIDKRFKKSIYVSEDPSSLVYQAFWENAKHQVLKDYKQNPDILTG